MVLSFSYEKTDPRHRIRILTVMFSSTSFAEWTEVVDDPLTKDTDHDVTFG